MEKHFILSQTFVNFVCEKFRTLVPGVNAIKLFPSSIQKNKVECFHGSFFHGCVIFAKKAMLYHLTVQYSKGKQWPGNTKGGSITVQLTSCLTGLESTV